MVGGKPTPQAKDEEEEHPADSTQLTARDISILERSQQDIIYQEGNPESAARDYHEQSSGNQGYALRVASPSMDCNNPFLEDHASNTVHTGPTPLFQRPVRSHSIDNSSIGVFTDVHPREQLIAGGYTVSPFPPRQPTSLHSVGNIANNSQQEMDSNIMPPLRRIWNPNDPLHVRPPTHLPPLQCSVERLGHQRRKHKRRRGHSWHGERINGQSIAVTASTMAIVAE